MEDWQAPMDDGKPRWRMAELSYFKGPITAQKEKACNKFPGNAQSPRPTIWMGGVKMRTFPTVPRPTRASRALAGGAGNQVPRPR